MQTKESLFCRKQIIFTSPIETVIPYDNNYEVMKNCYYYLSISDQILEKMLHNQGYRVESGHIYKLFNFTLLFENAHFTKQGIKINKYTILKLIISGKEDIIKKIIKGILHAKKIKLQDNEFILKDIKVDKSVLFNNIMLYKALSPVIETSKDDNCKPYTLTVYESLYYKNLIENAKRKYKLIYQEDFKGEIFFDIDDIDEIKSKSFKVKEIYNNGYIYNVWVQTSPKMQKIIYYLGLGQNSSSGAGCLSYITSRKEA